MKIAPLLLRLYPRKWREKYGDEFIALLEQTGVGWEQAHDVVLAASRERLRTLSRGALSPAVSHQASRLAGFVSLSWISVWMLQSMLSSFRIPTISFLSWDDHLRLLATLLLSALVSRLVDNWALPHSDAIRPPRPTARAIGLLSSLIAVVVCFIVGPRILLGSPIALGVVSMGQGFGRTRGALAALTHSAAVKESRASSIATLGLSA